MPRRATGSVVKRARKGGVYYGLRFTLPDGTRKFVTLGSVEDGWTQRAAEDELANTLADVRRGTWRPPGTPETVLEDASNVPTFHEFSTDWLNKQTLEGGRHGTGLAEKSREDLEWRLSTHLLLAFRRKRLDEITRDDVDRFRLGKVAEAKEIKDAAAKRKPLMEEFTDRRGLKHRRPQRPLSPQSINKLIATLAAILEDAVERELIPRNVAQGRKRRLRTSQPQRSWLDRAIHIKALLDAARALDKNALARKGQRRALLATLVFAGPRIGEALALRWQDLDLARGTIRIRGTKTDAAERTINLLPVLRDELVEYRATLASPKPSELVFGTTTGAKQSKQNVRNRILLKAVAGANKQLAKEGHQPLPDNLTHHGLRRTFASLLFAKGEPPTYVKAQMGHTTANLTLAIYAKEMDRRDGEPERLKALVEGADWTDKGTRVPNQPADSNGKTTASVAETSR
jgi:integrase